MSDRGLSDESGVYDFSHLLDHTMHVSVEDAAVRDPEGEASGHPADSSGATPATPDDATKPPGAATRPPAPPADGEFCENCGHTRQPGDRFCEHCGARLAEPSPPTPAPGPASSAGPAPSSGLRMTLAHRKDHPGHTAADEVAGPAMPAMGGPAWPAPPSRKTIDPGVTQTFRDELNEPPPIDDHDAPLPTDPPSSVVDPMPADFPAPAPTQDEPVAPAPANPGAGGLISSVPGIGNAAPGPLTHDPGPVVPAADDQRDVIDDPPGAVDPSIIGMATGGALIDAIPSPGDLAPSRPAAVEAAPEPASGPTDMATGDDPGTTPIDAFRATRAAHATPPGPTVQAVHCPEGHPNPPNRESCRVCDAAITDRRISIIPRPVLGAICFDDGRAEPLDQPLVIGRKPLADETTGSEPGRAITIEDPDKLLSRVHAEIRLAEWQVQVIDRDSMNHTFVQLPGQVLFQLRPGDPFPIPPGTRIVFAEVAECHYRLQTS